MTYTSPGDVLDRWRGDNPPDDDSKLVTNIEDAEDTILAAIPDLDDRVTDGRIPQARLKKIVAQMVIRHIRNPEGVRQTQETTGPFTRGVTFGGDEPGTVFLTKAERRELLGQTAKSGRAFQIDMVPARRRRAYDAEC